MTRAAPEQTLQRQVVQYLDLALHPHVFFSAIGHGGGGRVRGAILRGMGVIPGVPDLCFVHEGRSYWIELKAAKGRVSAEQDACHAWLRRAGAKVAVCRSLGEVCLTLAEWGIPMRAKVAA